MAAKTITVNPSRIARNEKNGTDLPVIIILENGKTVQCNEAVIEGESTIKYDKYKKSKTASCWIETEAEVRVIR